MPLRSQARHIRGAAIRMLLSSGLLLLHLAMAVAQDSCTALSDPPNGVRLLYFFNATHPRGVQPNWHAATRTSTVGWGTWAVYTCKSGSHLLLVDGRPQPTGTFNSTCTRLSSQAAAFVPALPDGAAIACKPNISFAWPLRCGLSQAPCGGQNCCGGDDTCDAAGMQGAGLCCPKGTAPCGGRLCCSPGEACQVWQGSARCCSEGTKPCGMGACCGAGERCFPDVNRREGRCCPAGSSQPCGVTTSSSGSDLAPHLLDTASPTQSSIQPLPDAHSADEVDAVQPSWRDGGVQAQASITPGSCAVPCGANLCCKAGEACITPPPTPNTRLCVPESTLAGAGSNCTKCGPSCSPERCLPTSACCPPGRRACGAGSCCWGPEKCSATANGGQGLCCLPGQEATFIPLLGVSQCCTQGAQVCGTMCCAPGTACDQRSDDPRLATCCQPGSRRCGQACCQQSEACWPDARGGRGQCCPQGWGMCGTSACCGGTHTCYAAANGGKGLCCPPRHEAIFIPLRNTSECCIKGSQVCGQMCCPPGFTCNKQSAAAGVGTCVPAGSSPCGEIYCYAGDVCWPDARGGKGLCCPRNTSVCGTSTCCGGPGKTCVVPADKPEGLCCADKQACGSRCCWYGSVCRGGQCVRDCPLGSTPCADQCCGTGTVCKAVKEPIPGSTQVHHYCMPPDCPQGGMRCRGACCGKGQVCSVGGGRCCSPRDAACLASDSAGGVQCGGAFSFGRKTCRLHNELCFLNPEALQRPPLGQQPWASGSYCCADGTGPCANSLDKCCAPDTICSISHDEYSARQACCPRGTRPCSGLCCGEGEWCHMWFTVSDPSMGRMVRPRCLPASQKPCGYIACERNATCFSSAGYGLGLCCPMGYKPCPASGGGEDRGSGGDLTWRECCPVE